ncbi:MAG: FkbM family methyltransferase [Pseudobacter sp.]|uniref:FkbM family methyltransferase n=1 Tax=Pseudobacter sp. TaxID=2045420 RepID=UPI003F823176
MQTDTSEVVTNGIVFNKVFNRISGRLKRMTASKGAFHLSRWRHILIRLKSESTSNSISFKGAKLRYRNPDEFLTIHREIFTEHSYRFVAACDQPLILDCGSHFGMAIVYWKNLYPGAKIIAFEPDPSNFEMLKSNTGSLGNIEYQNKAVWVHDGIIEFEDKGNWGSKIVEGGSSESKTIKVPCVKLSSFIQNRKIDFLKLDIEGAEYEVLKDIAPLLSNVENLFLEYHGSVKENYKLEELLALIRSAGFSYYIKEAAQVLNQPFVEKFNKDAGFDIQLNIFCYRM